MAARATWAADSGIRRGVAIRGCLEPIKEEIEIPYVVQQARARSERVKLADKLVERAPLQPEVLDRRSLGQATGTDLGGTNRVHRKSMSGRHSVIRLPRVRSRQRSRASLRCLLAGHFATNEADVRSVVGRGPMVPSIGRKQTAPGDAKTRKFVARRRPFME